MRHCRWLVAAGVLLMLLSLRPQGAAVALVLDPSGGDSVPGELIVRYREGKAVSAAALAGAGLRPLRSMPLGMAVLAASGPSARAAAADLEATGLVEWAEPNYTFQPDFVPDDPRYSSQTPYLRWLQVETAWDVARGAPQVILAVLDTGVDLTHPDLKDAIWNNMAEVTGLPGVDDDNNGFIDDLHGWDFADNHNELGDDYGHGTHVAGIAAAGLNNATGIAGVAGGVTIMPVDVFGGGIGTYEDLIRAIVYATDNGANVINLSLGASSYSRGEEMAVNYAVDHGVVVVAAAGNQGREMAHYPAAHPAAIAVASTTANDDISSFSNRGDWVDVAAPGSGVYSTVPGGGYAYKSGTSMASPHVAGLAALILSRNPDLTPQQVRTIIEDTADDRGAQGFDIAFGHGRVNAGRALQQTPSGAGDGRIPLPPLDMDLPGCSELLVNGNFISDLDGWQTAGSVAWNADPAFEQPGSAAFKGGPNATGTLSQTFTLPARVSQALLRFAYRIQTTDGGYGTNPALPYDDMFHAELQTPAGGTLVDLLDTGNTADTSSSGLPWDRYLYRFDDAALAAVNAARTVTLSFTSRNDADTAATNVWVDSVRLCVVTAPTQTWYFPLIVRSQAAGPLP